MAEDFGKDQKGPKKKEKENTMEKVTRLGMALGLMLALGSGAAMGATIDVGNADFTYGHNVGSFGGFSDNDLYARNGGFFDGGKWYLNPGQNGYMIFKYEADEGYTMDEIALGVQTYFEAGSWLSVLYRTTD